jgi:hypothetical protein
MSDDEGTSDARLNTVPVFKGVKTLYPDWKRKFESVADFRGCADALLELHEAKMPARFDAVLASDDPGKAQKKAMTVNKAAMAMLNIGLNGKAMGLLITGSYTPDWPRGRAWVVMAALERRFSPHSFTKMVNFTSEVAAVSMKAKEALGTLIDTLQDIQVRYTMLGLKVQEENLVAQAVLVAPNAYAGSLVQLQRERLRDNETMTLEDVREVMDQFYDLTMGDAAKKASASAEADDKKEVSLSQTEH